MLARVLMRTCAGGRRDATGEELDEALLDYLACPNCASDLVLTAPVRDGRGIVSGTLSCEECDARFPILAGIPRMNMAMDGLQRVAEAFGYEWKAHHQGQFESNTLYGKTMDQDWRHFLDALKVPESQVTGAVALDAGCGSGRFTRQIAQHGATAVIGMDFNEAVDEAFAYCRGFWRSRRSRNPKSGYVAWLQRFADTGVMLVVLNLAGDLSTPRGLGAGRSTPLASGATTAVECPARECSAFAIGASGRRSESTQEPALSGMNLSGMNI